MHMDALHVLLTLSMTKNALQMYPRMWREHLKNMIVFKKLLMSRRSVYYMFHKCVNMASTRAVVMYMYNPYRMCTRTTTDM